MEAGLDRARQAAWEWIVSGRVFPADGQCQKVRAPKGRTEGYAALIETGEFQPVERYEAFFALLVRDANDAMAAVELVLAQPAISSQLIDNLNASIHVRTLLTDMFLIEEILEAHEARSTSEHHEVS